MSRNTLVRYIEIEIINLENYEKKIVKIFLGLSLILSEKITFKL